tara:strand:- start:410 stop:784 length:375 start_codon:yes stop_codon:yes gene_type:complete
MSKNLYNTLYGSPLKKGNGSKRSPKGALQIGNGNLTPRKRMVKKRMVSNGGVNGGGIARGLFGFIGQSLKTCNCFQQNLAGEQIEGPTLSTNCRRWQKCSKCCSNSFGNDWYGEDPISSIIRRR